MDRLLFLNKAELGAIRLVLLFKQNQQQIEKLASGWNNISASQAQIRDFLVAIPPCFRVKVILPLCPADAFTPTLLSWGHCLIPCLTISSTALLLLHSTVSLLFSILLHPQDYFCSIICTLPGKGSPV